MAPPDEVVLRLRFREHQPSPEPPDIRAFLWPATPATPATPARRGGSIGVVPGRRPQAPDAPLVVFFQYASHGIPAITGPGHPASALAPDPTDWSIRPTAFGYLAQVSPPRAPARPRVAWLVAACLPLVIPARADAAPQDPPAVQRPQKGPSVPRLPDDDDAETDPETDSETSPETSPETSSETESDAGLTFDPTLDPRDRPLASAIDPTLGPAQALENPSDPALIDAAWEGVDGFDVVLELKGGQRMTGRVGAVQRETFTLIQSKTGAVLVLPKSGVVSLRVQIPPPLPAKNGTGLIVGGAILTAVGTPVFVSGLTFLGICPSCAYLHLPMLLIGGGALAGGIPMLIRGNRQRKAYREALQKHAVAPVALRTPHGWTGGLRFRF